MITKANDCKMMILLNKKYYRDMKAFFLFVVTPKSYLLLKY